MRGARKLTKEEIQGILQAYDLEVTVTVASIAQRYRVSQMTVYYHVNKRKREEEILQYNREIAALKGRVAELEMQLAAAQRVRAGR